MGRESFRRVVRGRKPRWLLSGAAVSLLGYLALAALAAQQQIFMLNYDTRARGCGSSATRCSTSPWKW